MRTEKQLSTPLLVAELDDTDASMGLMLGKETALEDVAFEYTVFEDAASEGTASVDDIFVKSNGRRI